MRSLGWREEEEERCDRTRHCDGTQVAPSLENRRPSRLNTELGDGDGRSAGRQANDDIAYCTPSTRFPRVRGPRACGQFSSRVTDGTSCRPAYEDLWNDVADGTNDHTNSTAHPPISALLSRLLTMIGIPLWDPTPHACCTDSYEAATRDL